MPNVRVLSVVRACPAAALTMVFMVGAGGLAGAEDVTITAPESIATIAPSERDGRGDFSGRVIVDGWSCGSDVTPDVVAVLAELSRRRAILSRQVSAGTALAKTPAVQQETDRTRRLRTYDDALAGATANAPPEILALTRREELDFAEIDEIVGLRAYAGNRAFMQKAGVTDGGATRLHVLPDCYQTTHVQTLVAQIRGAAVEIDELRQELREIRNAVASSGGV